jgi:hypothetical protein
VIKVDGKIIANVLRPSLPGLNPGNGPAVVTCGDKTLLLALSSITSAKRILIARSDYVPG